MTYGSEGRLEVAKVRGDISDEDLAVIWRELLRDIRVKGGGPKPSPPL